MRTVGHTGSDVCWALSNKLTLWHKGNGCFEAVMFTKWTSVNHIFHVMSTVIMIIIWISQHYWQGTQRSEAMQRPGWSGGFWTCPALLGGTFRGWSHSQEVSEGMQWLSQGRKKRDVNSQPEISRALGPTTMSSVLLLLSLRKLQDIQAVGFYCHHYYYYYFMLAVDKLGGWIGEKVQLCVAIVGMEAEMIVVDDLTKVRHEGGEEDGTKHRALRDASVDGGAGTGWWTVSCFRNQESVEAVRPLEAGGRLVREHGVEDPIKGSREAEEEFNDSNGFQTAKPSNWTLYLYPLTESPSSPH